MTKEELDNLINKLDTQISKDIALFEVNQYGGGLDESFIKANKEGLQLFALELLKASLKVDEIARATEKKVIHFENEEILANSDVGIHYIKPTLEKRRNVEPGTLSKKGSWKEELTKFGCIAGVLILAFATILGVIEILKWLF